MKKPAAIERAKTEILSNRKARHNYQILETLEAGIALKGTEVKSLRAGKGQIRDAFARIENDEAFLHNAHIDEYDHGNLSNHAPKAKRKLLLHKREIRKLFGLESASGHALVPLSFYWKNGKVKVLLGVAKGKERRDKRRDLRAKEADREARRSMMHRQKGRKTGGR